MIRRNSVRMEDCSEYCNCMICGKEIPRPKFSFGGRGDSKSMMRLMYNMRQLCCSDECWNEFIEEIRKEIK